MDKKQCSKCKKDKGKEEFVKKSSSKDGYASACKLCTRKSVNRHYSNNVDYYVKKAKKNSDILLEENRPHVLAYLEANPCVDCGESNLLTLDFDHINPDEKSYTVSRMVKDFKWETILKEIEKCEIRCANCHRIRTANQFGYWKLTYMGV